MDGIDAAMIETDGQHHIKEIADHTLTYAPEFHQLLKAAEYVVHQHKGNLEAAHKADFMHFFQDYLTEIIFLSPEQAQKSIEKAALYLKQDALAQMSLADVIDHSTHLHSRVVKELMMNTKLTQKKVDVIGYHGQTLFHAPQKGISIQVGDGQTLSDETGVTVINDFRSNDMAQGGQGAPLAPLYHQALAIRDKLYPVAVVNCGGIANITIINGPEYKDLLAYDTGPGNSLVDLFVKQRTQFKENMDYNGKYGLRGKTNPKILVKLYEKSIPKNAGYYKSQPPKSLDINDFHLIPELDQLSLSDGCATLESFTADSIISSLNLNKMSPPKKWILAGGGWNNPVIKRELEFKLKKNVDQNVEIKLANEIGWNNKAMEAQIFAYLAVRSIKGLPISLPQTTKVLKPTSGGKVYVPVTKNTW